MPSCSSSCLPLCCPLVRVCGGFVTCAIRCAPHAIQYGGRRGKLVIARNPVPAPRQGWPPRPFPSAVHAATGEVPAPVVPPAVPCPVPAAPRGRCAIRANGPVRLAGARAWWNPDRGPVPRAATPFREDRSCRRDPACEELPVQFLAGAVQPRFHGFFGDVQDLGHLCVTAFGKVSEDDDDPMVV